MAETPAEVRRLIERIDFKPSKRFGQNFLIDRGSIGVICSFAALEAGESVLEIGPGLGAISPFLAAHSKNYYAVELEAKFIPLLLEALPKIAPANIICSDIRDVDLTADERFGSSALAVISNVPYSLSSEIILWILRQRARISRAALLLQREFAERVAAKPGGKEYGSLTVLCNLYADARIGPKISGSCFFPPAAVESRLLELKMLPTPREQVDAALLEKLVRSSFSARRKTLLNSISGSGNFGEKKEVDALLNEAGIDPVRRAETLSLSEFAGIVRILERRGSIIKHE